jgi:hypothetical protein
MSGFARRHMFPGGRFRRLSAASEGLEAQIHEGVGMSSRGVAFCIETPARRSAHNRSNTQDCRVAPKLSVCGVMNIHAVLRPQAAFEETMRRLVVATLCLLVLALAGLELAASRLAAITQSGRGIDAPVTMKP